MLQLSALPQLFKQDGSIGSERRATILFQTKTFLIFEAEEKTSEFCFFVCCIFFFGNEYMYVSN